jgi:hypothetical protein
MGFTYAPKTLTKENVPAFLKRPAACPATVQLDRGVAFRELVTGVLMLLIWSHTD